MSQLTHPASSHSRHSSSQRRVAYSKAGTDVATEIVFYKITEVNVASGVLKIKCWLRLEWQDLRLAWDPADHGGISQVPFLGATFADRDASEIWLPDLTAYNVVQRFLPRVNGPHHHSGRRSGDGWCCGHGSGLGPRGSALH